MYKATSRFRQRLAKRGKKGVNSPNLVLRDPIPIAKPGRSGFAKRLDLGAAARHEAERKAYAADRGTTLVVRNNKAQP
jgi:hypothetical protein